MTSFNELVIGSSQGFAFLLKIITEVFQDYVHLQGHGLAMISHKCEPSVSKEFNLFSVVDFYCLCVCHSNSPTVCSALKNGHLLCRIEHFHFLDGILTSLCIFYSLLFTVLSLSWTVCALMEFKFSKPHHPLARNGCWCYAKKSNYPSSCAGGRNLWPWNFVGRYLSKVLHCVKTLKTTYEFLWIKLYWGDG